MSVLLYDGSPRGTVTKIDINGQGSEAKLDPGAPLIIGGEFAGKNPKSDPTDTLQLILFLNDKFLKCIYNDVPAVEPGFTEGSFTCKCTTPIERGKYTLAVGWAYNWNWPEQAYNYLVSSPERIEVIGSITVGAPAPSALIPAAVIAIPLGTIILMAATPKK